MQRTVIGQGADRIKIEALPGHLTQCDLAAVAQVSPDSRAPVQVVGEGGGAR